MYQFLSSWYANISAVVMLTVLLKFAISHKLSVKPHPVLPKMTKAETRAQKIGWLVEVNDYFFNEFPQCDTEAELNQMYDFYSTSYDGLRDHNIRPDKLLGIARILSGKNDGSFPEARINPPKKVASGARQIIKSGDGSVNIQASKDLVMQDIWKHHRETKAQMRAIDNTIAFAAEYAEMPYDAFNPQSEGWTTQRAVKDGFIVYREGGFNTTTQKMINLDDAFCAYPNCPTPKSPAHVHKYNGGAIIE